MLVANLSFSRTASHLLALSVVFMLSACEKIDSEVVPPTTSEVGVSEVDMMIAELDEYLETATSITNEEFDENYAKNLVPEAEVAKLRRAHDLVASAVDPDPDWFSTGVDKSVLVTKQGAEHEITLNKKDFDGNVLGPVNNEQLRLVVKVQRSENDFEYITNVNIDEYAQWIAPGKLRIKVPDHLTQGRLIIGVRPNFEDVGQAAIAERWSTFILAEVWQVKPGVKEINSATVVFPIVNGATVSLSNESLFSKAEISEATSKRFSADSSLELPIVVQGGDLGQGDLIAYTLQGKPYSGRITTLEQRGNQYFALLAPEIFEVYEVTDAEDGFLINEGVLPEHVIYRQGEPLESTTDESDPTRFNRVKNAQKSLAERFVNVQCKYGVPLITLKFNTNYVSKDVGVDIKLHLTPDKVGCTWEALPVEYNIANGLATAGPTGIILKLFGSEIMVSLLGEITVTAELPPVGVQFGGSSAKGGYFKLVSIDTSVVASELRDLTAPVDEGFLPKISFATSLGLRVELNPVSENGGIGLTLQFLGIDFGSVGLVAKGGVKVVASTEAPSASKIYATGNPAVTGIKLLTFVDLSLSKKTEQLFKYFGVDIFKFQQESLIMPEMKAEAALTYKKLYDKPYDETVGKASIFGLSLTSSFLKAIFSDDPKGVLAPKNKESSVFNDLSENIEYSLSECNENDDSRGVIETPVYACTGIVCGKVNKPVRLCKGELDITRAIATARVEELAETTAIVSNHGPTNVEVTVSASGQTNSLDLTYPESSRELLSASGDSANLDIVEVDFSQTCPEGAGVYQGTVKVEGEAAGKSVEDTEKSYLVCTKDDNRGDPHIVTADGMGYDYYASGDYILSRVNDVSGYEVQARFLPGFKTSWPQAVSLKVGSDTVEIQGRRANPTNLSNPINALSIWINGQESYIGTSNNSNGFSILDLPSGGILAIPETTTFGGRTFPSSVVAIWPEGSQTESYGVILNVTSTGSPFVRIRIARPNTFEGQERGLMGNNDGDPNNDFIRRNGQVLGQGKSLSFSELYGLFGADWLVKPYESLFRNPEAIQPEFPSEVVTLTPEQRDLGAEACQGLTGFYLEACILDVGLSGSVDLVKELYSNTDDLNRISDAIVTPKVDSPRYELVVGSPRFPTSGSYQSHKQKVDVSLLSGQGSFILLVRPPQGGKATLSNGYQSYLGEGNFSAEVTTDCQTLLTETNTDFFPSLGALQLWIQDPLSGAASRMVSEVPLRCNSVNAGDDIKKIYGDAPFTQAATVDGQEGNLTYASSDLSVAHTGSDGYISIRGAGSTTITATLREKNEGLGPCYEVFPSACDIIGRDSYVLTVDKANAELNLGDDLTLTNNSSPIQRPVFGQFVNNTGYQSSDMNIATVDESGVVTLTKALGSATITANFSGDENFLESTNSYEINVKQFVEVVNSSASITLQWESAPNITRYNLYYSTESFSQLLNLSEYASLAEGTLIEQITGSQYIINNLDNEKVYYFVLEAVTDEGEVFVSNEIDARLSQDSDVKYVFAASDVSTSYFDPWVTDGTVSGTKKIKELVPVPNNTSIIPDFSIPSLSILETDKALLKNFDGDFFFSASRYHDDLESFWTRELWQTDGSEVGTHQVEGIDSKYSFDIRSSFVLPEYFVFSGSVTFDGPRILTLDKNGILNEFSYSFPSNYATFGNDFIFKSYSDIAGGSVAHQYSNGTISIIEEAGAYIHDPYQLINVADGLFYFTQTPSVSSEELKLRSIDGGVFEQTLWSATKDGSTPLSLATFRSVNLLQADYTKQILSFDSKLYFNTSAVGSESALWVSDGTVSGTRVVKEFSNDVVAKELYAVGNKILFQVVRSENSTDEDISSLEGIWSSDGTTEGTVRVKSLPLKQFNAYDTFFNATATSSLYYFISDDNSLWVSDGSDSGTRVIKQSDGETVIKKLVTQKQMVFFESSSNGYDYNLWRSDGTTGGTFSLGEDLITSMDGGGE